MKKILKTGLAALLALSIGCAKHNLEKNMFKSPNLPSSRKEETIYEDSKKRGSYVIREPTIGDCVLGDMDFSSLKNKNIDILTSWEDIDCVLPPKDLKPGENYVVKIREYYIISEKGNKDSCFEINPYITLFLLDNKVLIYYVDIDRDGIYDANKDFKLGNFNQTNLEELPEDIPEPDRKCYKDILI